MGEISRVLRGSKNPLQWLLSGKAAVTPEVSAARAAICCVCPKNGYGPLTNWFTAPTARKLMEIIQMRSMFKLSTPYDAGLGTCTVCFCVLRLKIHEPVDLVLKGLTPAIVEELPSKCWMNDLLPKSQSD